MDEMTYFVLAELHAILERQNRLMHAETVEDVVRVSL